MALKKIGSITIPGMSEIENKLGFKNKPPTDMIAKVNITKSIGQQMVEARRKKK